MESTERGKGEGEKQQQQERNFFSQAFGVRQARDTDAFNKLPDRSSFFLLFWLVVLASATAGSENHQLRRWLDPYRTGVC